MSGLIGGYIFNQRCARPLTAVRSACDLMAVGGVDNESSIEEPGLFSLCTVSSNGVHPCGVFEDEYTYSVFYGNLYNRAELQEQNEDSATEAASMTAQLVAKLYHKYGSSLVERLNGVFLCIIWAKDLKKLVLLSDRYGFEHLYYYRSKDVFLFSTGIFALIKLVGGQRVVDNEALADIFNFNMICGARSICSDIKLCRAAMRCEIANGKVEDYSYWDYPYKEPFDNDAAHLKVEAKRLISAASLRAVQDYDNVGALLSGGLDSRLLAAVLNEHGAIRRVLSYRLTEAQSNDYKIAELIAQQLSLPFHLISPASEGKIEDELTRVLRLTDGQFWVLELKTIIAASEKFPGIGLVNGFLLDTLFKSGWMVFQERDDCNRLTVNHLLKKYSVIGDYVFDRFLLPDCSSFLHDRRVQRFEEELASEDCGLPEHTSFTFYCRQRGRRVHYGLSKAYRNYTDFIMPGTEYNLFDFASRLPYRLRSDSRFYRELITELYPEVGAIPWDKTGRPLLDADRPRNAKYTQNIGKIKYFLQRVTQGLVDLENPPTSFNKRFRRDKKYRESVLDILTDKASMERGLYDQKGLERLVKEQLQGKDYARFFYALMSTEMLHRVIADV